MEAAPLFDDVARAPAGGEAWWLTTADGARIRAALWPAAAGQPARGTVLLFPGRTEYIEKYGPAAADFTARGFALLTVDWRGQGLADRVARDPRLGHVGDFAEFQRDVDALINLAQWLELPEPFFLIGHSMGGCIGLRALHNRLPVKAAVFSAPMWGMQMAPALRPVARLMAHGGRLLGLGRHHTPGTDHGAYVLTSPFADNKLTTDPEMWDFMKQQLETHPDLVLGGPTLGWLSAALRETAALTAMAAPDVPTLTFLGSHERIVETGPIKALMARWPRGRLEIVEGGEHEILMEKPATRARAVELASALFIGQSEAA